ncbi:MAG: IS4 family transposase [Mycobacterium sp.]
MPRAGWKKPETERRLSDLVSVGVLTRVFPPELVDEVIADVGRTEQRNRSLPARVMAYFSIEMALYSEGSYEDVLAQLTDGLSWASGWTETYSPPSKSAIFQAWARLGAEPIAALFERVAKPVGADDMAGVWLAGRRLVAIDGMCLDVADSAVNAEYFGRPGVNKGEQAAFPQARVVALAECGTHAVFAAEVGAYTESEASMADRLVSRLTPGMLLTADRGFFSYALWRKASATGADLLWRVRTDRSARKPVHVEDLTDGSWLGHLRQTHSAAARAAEPMLVRVIDYTLDRGSEDGRDNATSYRLFTTVLDPDEADATDLAAAYAQRWEVELTFDELKTHQRGPRTVLRSKSPDLVLQEIWGHLCCHYAIRSLMAEAARHSGHDPDRVSFVAALRITRQTLAHPGAFPLTSALGRAPAGWTSYADSCGGSTQRAGTAPRHA